jgi:hypothetical protein
MIRGNRRNTSYNLNSDTPRHDCTQSFLRPSSLIQSRYLLPLGLAPVTAHLVVVAPMKDSLGITSLLRATRCGEVELAD